MNKLMKQGIFTLLLLIFLSACPPTEDTPENGGTEARLSTPSVTRNPDRAFHNAPMTITLTPNPNVPDTSIYYTIDGTDPAGADGILYAGAITLPLSTVNTPRQGYTLLQFIARKEGYRDSLPGQREFQVFDQPAWGGGTYSGSSQGTGVGFDSGVIGVTLAFEDGVIVGVDIENGFGGSKDQSPGYWDPAPAHAEVFLPLMNHWDFDVRTNATASSTAIREAAKEAIEKMVNGP